MAPVEYLSQVVLLCQSFRWFPLVLRALLVRKMSLLNQRMRFIYMLVEPKRSLWGLYVLGVQKHVCLG